MFGQQKNNTNVVYVGLSGGVDSAVSAALLQEQGYTVVGVFIRIALHRYPCSAGVDKLEAMRVAAHLKIPFKEIDLSQTYQSEVFDTSLKAFATGETPNPDVLCNREVKFGAFYAFAKAQGADYIATGHYARTLDGKLFEGLDSEKDQSYFLWMVPPEALKQTLFPVGGLTKPQVRAHAKRMKLPNAQRKDSQGLCFLGDLSLGDVLQQELSPQPGPVLSETGEVVGRHRGVALYTLGQRHGFELSIKDIHTSAHFIVAKDTLKNTITVSPYQYPINATKTELLLREVNWFTMPQDGVYQARFRYRGRRIDATLTNTDDGVVVTLHEPQYVSLGQSLVLYRDDECIGGGIVSDSTLT